MGLLPGERLRTPSLNYIRRVFMIPDSAGLIASAILLLRAQKVILDADLAALYGVETRRLNEQVRRNAERFPTDFMFQVSAEELANLRSQFATSSLHTGKPAWGGRRYAPFAFTEHGAIMAATVLNSPRATLSLCEGRDLLGQRVEADTVLPGDGAGHGGPVARSIARVTKP